MGGVDQARLAAELESEGFCIVPDALDAGMLARVRDALDAALASDRAQANLHQGAVDPNDRNLRVVDLPAYDPVFRELLLREDAGAAVGAVLGDHYLVSNFTANVALPGSGQMRLHSDQSLVVPPPWPQPWAINIIWCLDDVHDANGATRYLPGSHRFQSLDELPADAMDRTVAFEAPAGSFIAMEGRLWHTSGANRTQDERRRMMFAYYAADFLRQQVNWALTLPADVLADFSARERSLFGVSELGNVRVGGARISLARA